LNINTVTFVFAVPLVPEMADRLTLHDEGDDEGQKVCDQPANDCPADVCKSSRDLFREDAKV
jgi:hypothetical protein